MKIHAVRRAVTGVIPAALMGFVFILAGYAAAEDIPKVNFDLSDAAVKRGEAVFASSCQTCHSLKYLGAAARMNAENAQSAFGKVPPDLSLMAKARGKGSEGAGYIYALLVGFNDTPSRNSVFPNIAMPPPLSQDDPQFMQKAKDIAAFLYYAADPSANERRRLGAFVLVYMAILTSLLYLLYRKTWRGIKRKHSERGK